MLYESLAWRYRFTAIPSLEHFGLLFDELIFPEEKIVHLCSPNLGHLDKLSTRHGWKYPTGGNACCQCFRLTGYSEVVGENQNAACQ